MEDLKSYTDGQLVTEKSRLETLLARKPHSAPNKGRLEYVEAEIATRARIEAEKALAEAQKQLAEAEQALEDAKQA